MIPYNWRPLQIWYRLKCWAWHRYTTVKPKTLPYHTWCDKTELLPHCIFEILTDFVTKECSPGHIDWYHTEYPKKIIPGQPYDHDQIYDIKAVWVRDEMEFLVNWWHNIYLKEREHCHNEWHNYIEKNKAPDTDFMQMEPIEYDEKGDASLYEWHGPKYTSLEVEKEADRLFKLGTQKEEKLEKELQENMVRVVHLTPFLWT